LPANKKSDLSLPRAVAAAMRSDLPSVAEQTVAAIIVEVPSYADAFSGEMGRTIENAVQVALGSFLDMATGKNRAAADTPIGPALEGAYALGRGEARNGRSMDALLAAYRVGARVAWRELSAIAVTSALPAETLGRFAELVFAYIDQLSAASVAGHADELATTGRVRQRFLERLSHSLLAGGPPGALQAAAERADWAPPRTLTAVILPEARARGALALLDPRTLQPTEDVPGLEPSADLTVLLVPDADGRSRRALLASLQGRAAVVGPARPWLQAQASYTRALRTLDLGLSWDGPAPLDTEEHLTDLVLGADPDALADLRAAALAPLNGLRPGTREKLAETLRSWLLHQGRRDEVAAELFVHTQTVRYRMGQLRELYGDQLNDPQRFLELIIALGAPTR
jgi:hypothetical protein